MYIIDFVKKLGRRSNIPIIIYLLLNVAIIGGAVSLVFSLNFFIGLAIGLGLYAISLLIALSPFGEWVLRMQTGCRKIEDPEQLAFLEPIFLEVYGRAKQLDPAIPDDVKLYINEDKSPNAFATGRKTICVTKGLLEMPQEQIKATLSHEFGHLAHKDTDLILLVSVGNMLVTAMILIAKAVIWIFHVLFTIGALFVGGSDGVIEVIFGAIYKLLTLALVSLATWIWTKIGTLLVMKSSRSREYEADEFAFDLGYGNELCMLLDTIGGQKENGLFANLASSHPSKEKRIERLKELGSGQINGK